MALAVLVVGRVVGSVAVEVSFFVVCELVVEGACPLTAVSIIKPARR